MGLEILLSQILDIPLGLKDPLRSEDNRNCCIVLDAMVVESQKQSQEVGAMIPGDLDRAVVELCVSKAKVIPLPSLVEANKEDLHLYTDLKYTCDRWKYDS